jgi:hypothetical protein
VSAEHVQPDGQLELEVRPPEHPVPVGEDVPISIALANRDSVPLIVNRRLLIAPPSTPKPFREVTFEVQGPPGYVNRKVVQVNSGRPRPEDFAELPAGDTLYKDFELTRMHSMHLPGEYAVRATYTNTTEPEGFQPRPWIGTIMSGWTVVERPDR